MGVADGIGQLHLFATAEQLFGVAEHVGIKAVGHRVAMPFDPEATHVIGRIDLGEDRVEVEIVEMLGAAADLTQQFGAADDFIERAHAEPCEDLAHFLGNEAHQIDDLFRRADEFLAQRVILGADTHRAGIAVALAHHDAAHGDQRQRADAIFLGAQNGSDDDVAAGLQSTIGAQLHPVAQAIEGQHLIDFGQPHFPGRAGIFDTGLRARRRAADMARDQDDIGMGLGDTGCHRADTGAADQFHTHPGARVDLLQIIDELSQILDRIDVVMRRRRDQRHAGGRMAQPGNQVGDLETGQLPALAGLGALRHLDLDFLAGVEILRRHAKAPRRDLLDHRIGIVAILIRREALAVLTTFAAHRFGADAVHRDGQRFMRFGRQCPQAHAGRDETLADFGDRFDFFDCDCLGRHEIEQVTQRDRRLFAHRPAEFEIVRIAVGADGMLQQMDHPGLIGMRLAASAIAIKAADRQRDDIFVKGRFVAHLGVDEQRFKTLARNLRWHAGEEIIDQRPAQSDRFEIIAAAIRRDDGDTHLGHDLEQAVLDRLLVAGDAFVIGARAEQAAGVTIGNGFLRQIGVDRGGADPDQHGEIMRVERFGRPHVDRGKGAQPLAYQMRMHTGSGEDHADPHARRRLVFIGQEQLALARSHRGFGFAAHPRDGCAQGVGSAMDVEAAIDFGNLLAEMRLEHIPALVGHHRRVDDHNAFLAGIIVQNVAEVGKARLETHHPGFAQGVDRRVGDLRKILPEKVRQVARIFRYHRQRRIIAHAADGFLGIIDHRAEQQFHVFHGLSGGNLAATQLVAAEPRAGLGAVMALHRSEGGEARHHRGIIMRGGNPILDLAIRIKTRSGGLERTEPVTIKIDGDHLAGAERALHHHVDFGDDHHAGFRAGDEQAVARQAIAHRPQRVAVEPGHHPAAIGHRERRRPVPGLHDTGKKGVHRPVRLRQAVILAPGFGNQHQLGRRRIAARADKGFEDRIERGGIRRAGRNQRLDVARMFTECRRRHLDLVAFHPVGVAAHRVDLAVMGEAAERLRQPPLREGIGAVALVIDGKARDKAFIHQIGIENRQFLGEEQALVDDRPRRQRADVETLRLAFDDLFLDAAADEIKVLFERLDRRGLAFGTQRRIGERPGNHDLFDFGARQHRLVADHRHIDRHLAPAIDLVAKADDFGFDDGAAGLLRRQIGARQENLADGEQIGLGRMAGTADMFVEEIEWQFDMDAGAIAGLAIGIDGTAVPDCLQGFDTRHDDAARRLAIGSGDQPDATGI